VIFAHLVQSASNLPTAASALESAISALERDIKALESSSLLWENLLPWFTALVAVGVAMEFWVISRERRDDIEAWKRATILPPERPSTAKFVIELVSLVLITGGIVGELGIGITITSINGKLRTMNAELRDKGDQLVGLLHVEASIAEQNAAAANRIAEAEKLARVKLQQYIQARRLTGKQKEQLTKLLSENPQSIMIGYCLSGSDCIDFANDIGDAFNKAGWKTFWGASTSNKRGIEVGFAKGSDEALAAEWVPKIRHALGEIGVDSNETWFGPNDKTLVGGFEKNVLYLIVHNKPELANTTSK